MSKLFIVLLIFVFFVCGIANGEELVDRNVLIDEYGLEDSELLDAFILKHQMTEAYLKEINVQYLFELYKENAENAANNFDYLFEEAEDNGENEFLQDLIDKVAFFENPNNEIRALMFDLAAGKVYFGEYFIYHDIREAESLPLDSEKTVMLIDTLSKTSGWEAFYSSSAPENSEESEDTVEHNTSWHSWALSIEFVDGSIRQFAGSGPSTDHYPEDFAVFSESLFAISQ